MLLAHILAHQSITKLFFMSLLFRIPFRMCIIHKNDFRFRCCFVELTILFHLWQFSFFMLNFALIVEVKAEEALCGLK
jgi:hypothetical protein